MKLTRIYSAVKPKHYSSGTIECIDAIASARGTEAALEFCICNAMKYLWRLGRKDDPEQEARKAIWYLEKYIKLRQDARSKKRKGLRP